MTVMTTSARLWVTENSSSIGTNPRVRLLLTCELHEVVVDVGVTLEVRAAVEVQHFAGDPGRLRRAQERNCVGDVLGGPDPPEWSVLQVLLDHPGDHRGPFGQWGRDVAGGDGVDPDSARPEFE